MHEALCRSSGTTLDILHAERRAADHSANIGSKPSNSGGTGTGPPMVVNGDRLDQARVIVLDVADPPAHRPASHRLRCSQCRQTPSFICRLTGLTHRAHGTKVRRLAAGGNRIRTIG